MWSMGLFRSAGGVRHSTLAAATVAAIAGGSTRWLTAAPVPILLVIAAAAVVIVLAWPEAPLWAVVGAAVSAAVALHLIGFRLDAFVRGVAFGLVVALVLSAPAAVRQAVRQRREFHRRGWALAAQEAGRRAVETRAALQQERMRLAAEMHDGLGHSLTLIAVRLGHLSMTPDLDPRHREEVMSTRRLAAEAADELGVAVRLLRRSRDSTDELTRADLDDVVEGAKAAGMTVATVIAPGWENGLGQQTVNAVARVVQESLTNAAKHAPGSAVRIAVERGSGAVEVTIDSRLAETTGPRSPGVGLEGLRHRAELLGGRLQAGPESEQFVVRLRLPERSRMPIGADPDPVAVVSAEETAAHHKTSATRAAVAVPAAIVGALAFVAVGYFVLANTVSVLSPSDFADIADGAQQAAVEERLPPLQLLDPPVDRFPARAGEVCRYHESRVSFFERVDVLVVCFADGRVSRTGTVIPS